ncbi:MAG: ABC transporter permease [Bacteroidia bacterium]
MIIQIAYRNIWRNKLRTWVLILAIAIGIWGGLLVIALAKGLTQMRQKKAIETYVSHVQVHHPDFVKYGELNQAIPNANQLLLQLENDPDVENVLGRIKTESFIQSAGNTSAVVINGVVPEKERALTTLPSLGQTGNFLEDFKSYPPIVLGEKLAIKLNVGVKDKVQCSLVDAEGGQVEVIFKVTDLYRTANALYDESNAFVLQEHLADYLGNKAIHEIAIGLSSPGLASSFAESLQIEIPEMQVDDWREIAPELGFADKMMDFLMSLFLLIIMFALSFGIVNTMLMAVLERKKEIGMLLSVGMNKKKIFRMIALESLMVAALSVPVGLGLAIGTISLLKRTGIDLGFLSEGLRTVGLESVLYPYLEPYYYVQITLLVVATAVLSCIYPARKALKFNPAETLRTAI